MQSKNEHNWSSLSILTCKIAKAHANWNPKANTSSINISWTSLKAEEPSHIHQLMFATRKKRISEACGFSKLAA